MNIDLPYHQPCIENEEINEVVDTLKSGWLTTGPRTFQFEEDFRQYVGCHQLFRKSNFSSALSPYLMSIGDVEKVIGVVIDLIKRYRR